MKRIWIILFLAALNPELTTAADLSLQTAANMLLESNPAYRQKVLEAEIAKKQWNSTQASYLPQVDFYQTWNYSNNPVYVFGTLLNQRRFSADNFALDSLNNPEALGDFSSKFQLGWLLFDFGRRENRNRAAEIGYTMSDLLLQSGRADLLLELVRRYFGVSLAKERMRTADDAKASAQSRYDQAKAREAEGMIVKSDLLSVQVFAARKEQESIESKNQSLLAVAALYELLGTSGEMNIMTAPLKEKEFEERDLELWRQDMRQNRPELKIVEEGARLAKAQRKSQQGEFLPSLQLWSSYEWHGESLNYTGDNWGTGFELKWNLFKGGSDYRQLSAAQLREQAASEKLRETENALWLQLQTAYYHWLSARDKWKVARTSVEQAEENRRIYAERYGTGLVSIQDSLQAETAYSETRLMYLQNLYDVYTAYAELLTASGRSGEILTVFTEEGAEK